jgi:hypothetical protein
MEPAAVGELFGEDATMVFANGEPMVGREAVVAGNAAFMATIKALRQVSIPAMTIWSTREDGLIVDLRVFVEITPVYAP